MLCPKCGQEYTGASCPRCEGPQIIVNNQEYLKRKLEYERKQAGVESASSSSASNDTEASKGKQQEDIRPDEVFKKLVERTKQGGGNADRQEISAEAKKRRKKLAIRVIVGLIAAVAVVLGAVAAYRIIRKNNLPLYTRYNGKIYNISGIDSVYVCDYDAAYFTSDGKKFYTPDEPGDIAGKNVTLKIASENGKYFASEVYDETSGRYTLYLWNESAGYALSDNSYKKNILYLADDGTVVYRETQMINDVGGMGKSNLYISQLAKGESAPTSTLLSENVRQAFVYADEQLVIYNDEDDRLYSYSFGRSKTVNIVAEDVSAVYPMYEGSKGYYSYKAGQLNTDKDVSTFVYISNGAAFLYDCLDKDETSIAIDSTTSVTGEYIITDNNGIYAINSSKIRYASYKNKQTGTYSELVSLGNTSNVLYFPDRELLVAVASDGHLQSVSRGVVSDLAQNVAEGTLSAVNNTDSGIVYVRSNVLYYANVLTGSELIMSEAGSSVSTSDTLMYRKRLYYYNSAGKLCSCTIKGSDNKLIGDVEKFWLGE
jgi:hypothetical protein